MDYDIYKAIDAAGPHWLDQLFNLVANDLVVVIVAIVAALFLIPWRRLRLERRRAAVIATASAALALLADQPIAHAVDRVRPFVAHPSAELLISRSTDPSFPSDHAAGAFAIAVAVWLYDRVSGWVLLALAALLAFARVYVGTHYPSDVVGGALIGTAVALVLHWRPVRARLEWLADLCGRIWDRILAAAGIRPRAAGPA